MSSPDNHSSDPGKEEPTKAAHREPTRKVDRVDELTPPMSVAEPELTSAEVTLAGPIPRAEPTDVRLHTSALYIRLEGRIYGPVDPDRMELLLESGTLTGLETASVDLRHWTPLAYHPRIVRGRIRDLERVHEVLTELSTLPIAKNDPSVPIQVGPPQAAILRRPGKTPGGHKSAKASEENETAESQAAELDES